MKAYLKSTGRMFKRQLTRFLTIVAIIFVSVGLMAGIGEVQNKIDFAIKDYYQSQNVPDLIIKSKKMTGFSPEEISYLQYKFGTDNIQTSFSYDTKIDDEIIRIYNYELNSNINKLELLEGNFPTSDLEVLVQRKTDGIKSYEVGDKINLSNGFIEKQYTVSGIVRNPLIIHKVKEPSTSFENEHIDKIIYLNNTSFMPIKITNDVYVSLADREIFNSYSKTYKTQIEELKSSIELAIVFFEAGIHSLLIMTRWMTALRLWWMLAFFRNVLVTKKIFFLLVTALVVFSTMTRLLDEERSQIACLKTLGYSDVSIVGRYQIFISLASIIGGLMALAVGNGITKLLYSAFDIQYAMPPFPKSVPFFYFLLSFLIILTSALVVTTLSGLKLTKNKPAVLLTPKAPHAGKKVLMERIPFVWNSLSFKYKSSFRNVFLFKSRFFMTVVSIIGSTVLVLSGLGLLDNALKTENSDSLIMIAAVLIVFAGLLCALVIYNITNINISERNREIATLMVLGYSDKEVSGYIFREIYIMSFIGAILGVPLGLGFLEFVFNFISFGSISNVNWWTWIITPVITIIFTTISSMLLYKKIVKTNMNESLKTLD